MGESQKSIFMYVNYTKEKTGEVSESALCSKTNIELFGFMYK
jgi:hypothetical protein